MKYLLALSPLLLMPIMYYFGVEEPNTLEFIFSFIETVDVMSILALPSFIAGLEIMRESEIHK